MGGCIVSRDMANDASCVIYCHTNQNNNKRYVGWALIYADQTPNEGMLRRWKDHLQNNDELLFHRAIRKHGEDAFLHEVLEVTNLTADAKSAEKRWIAELRTCVLDDGWGYNMTRGGDGGQTFEWNDDRKARASQRFSGEGNVNCKLTSENIRFIRNAYDTGSMLQRELAETFGVSQLHISGIVRNMTWVDNEYKPVVRELGPNPLAKPRKTVRLAHNVAAVQQLDRETSEVLYTYASLTLAALAVGARSTGNIISCCKGSRSTANGYRWRYVNG